MSSKRNPFDGTAVICDSVDLQTVNQFFNATIYSYLDIDEVPDMIAGALKHHDRVLVIPQGIHVIAKEQPL